MAGSDVFELLEPAVLLQKRFGFLHVKFTKENNRKILEKCTLHLVIWTVVQISILAYIYNTAVFHFYTILFWFTFNSRMDELRLILRFGRNFAGK